MAKTPTARYVHRLIGVHDLLSQMRDVLRQRGELELARKISARLADVERLTEQTIDTTTSDEYG